MKNAVIYEKRTGYFTFSRGGVNGEGRPIDPYNRLGYFNLSGYHGYYIVNGYSKEEKQKWFDFLGMDIDRIEKMSNPAEKVLVWEEEFKIVFDTFGNPILYRGCDKDPVRVSKVCVRKDKFYKEWGETCGYPSKENPVEVRGWDFGKVKHIRMCNYNVKDLHEIVPELFGAEPYAFIKPEFEDGACSRWDVIKKAYEYLYGLEPIDLSKSYDYTKEEWVVLDEKEREAEEKEAEKERLKHLPGHCNVCGCVGDEKGVRWRGEFDRYMCDDCYEWHVDVYGDNSDDE